MKIGFLTHHSRRFGEHYAIHIYPVDDQPGFRYKVDKREHHKWTDGEDKYMSASINVPMLGICTQMFLKSAIDALLIARILAICLDRMDLSEFPEDGTLIRFADLPKTIKVYTTVLNEEYPKEAPCTSE